MRFLRFLLLLKGIDFMQILLLYKEFGVYGDCYKIKRLVLMYLLLLYKEVIYVSGFNLGIDCFLVNGFCEVSLEIIFYFYFNFFVIF